jgi:uncharacterized protein involved in outer membrane biogenesis
MVTAERGKRALKIAGETPVSELNERMKKFLLRIGIGLVVLVVLAVLTVSLFLDGAVKRAVETIGPKLTKVDIRLDRVRLSLLSGSGKISGLVVGNPEGFKTPQAISIGSASLSLQPGSLLSDKIVIKKIEVIAPEITFEGGPGGNNLSGILANLNAGGGGGGTNAAAQPAGEKPGRKLEVDDFIISGAKVHVSVTGLGGKALSVPIPEIHLTGLGAGPDGITAAELSKRVLTAIEQSAAKAASTAVAELGKGATDLVSKDLGKAAGDGASKISRGIGDLLKKKN